MSEFQPARLLFERRFYLGTALLALALVLWGFAHTYYLKLLFGSPPLSLRLHIHGIVMSSWIVLFVVQAFFIAGRRVDLHRRLGAFGVIVALLVVILGTTTTFNAAAREVGRHSEEANLRVTVLGLELMQMALFAGLVSAGIAMRRRSGYHKRLLLLATACMLPSAFSRIPVHLTFMVSGFLSILLLFDIFVVVCVLIDSIRNKRLHPAFGWGAGLSIAGLNLAYFIASRPAWIKFGSWLVS